MQMEKLKTLGLVLSISAMTACAAGLSSTVTAGTFDGSQSILCSSVDVFECDIGAECMRVSATDIDAPQFFRIDFSKKTIVASREGDRTQTTEIERMKTIDGKLILQGMEDGKDEVKDGLGWTLAIMQGTGAMVLTASGEQAGFVIMGACTTL